MANRRTSPPSCRAALGVVLLVAFLTAPFLVHAQATVTPRVHARFTLSDNAGLRPSGQEQSDLIVQITPALQFDYRGSNLTIDGGVAVNTAVYVNGTSADTASPQVNMKGEWAIVRDRLFLEAQALVTDTYYSPFGAQPAGALAPVDNRYNSQHYRVTPRVEGDLGSNISYRILDDNLWTTQRGEPVEVRDTYTNRLIGSIDRRPSPFGWGADIERIDYEIQGRDNQERRLVRGRAVWQPDAQLRLFASGGYENNRFPLTENSGAIYGAGLQWAPTPRTSLDARWEHRFFGPSYELNFAHRAVQSVYSVMASRNITSYPETIANLPPGTFLPGVMNELLRARIPDPAERLDYIRGFIDDRGLPLVLTDALSLYNEQIYLQEHAVASVGLLGVRNSVFFSAYRMRTEPIAGTGQSLPPLESLQNDNTQIGGSITWSYQLAAQMTATLYLDQRRTEANPPNDVTSDQTIAELTLRHTTGPRTAVLGGARWQRFRTTLGPLFEWDEAALYAGFTYSFR